VREAFFYNNDRTYFIRREWNHFKVSAAWPRNSEVTCLPKRVDG